MNESEIETKAARKIIHCDCDCFYAAVEIRDDPSLQGKAIAVGGSSDRRGVLTTCSYEARAFGIHSAMPTAIALRLCPDLIVLPVNMEKYRVASQAVQAILKQFTEQIEPLSLDEAFLDVSGSNILQGSATRIAQEIRRLVSAQVGITISAGVAPNKFLAKIASDWQKPDGLTVIRPEQVDDFVARLPVNKIFGVGKVTAAKLQGLGVVSCADLQKLSLLELDQKFGRFGRRLFELSRGIDPRDVQSERTRKSLSVEHTLSDNLVGTDACLQYLPRLVEELRRRLQKHSATYQMNKVFVKLKFKDFTLTTAEAMTETIDDELLVSLLTKAFGRAQLPVRLIGVGVRFKPEAGPQQELFAE